MSPASSTPRVGSIMCLGLAPAVGSELWDRAQVSMQNEAKRRYVAYQEFASKMGEWMPELHRRSRQGSTEERGSDPEFLRLVGWAEQLDAASRASEEAIRELHADGVPVADIAEGVGAPARYVLQVIGGPFSCAFCGRRGSDVSELIRGPELDVCDGCVALAASVVGGAQSASSGWTTLHRSEQAGERCSFCHRDVVEAGALAGVASSRICHECVDFAEECAEESVKAR